MQITRTFVVEAELPAIRDYLADFSHATEWDPGTERCDRRDAGDVRVGSTWDNTSKLAGISTELVYELVELTPTSVVLRGENDTATAEDHLTFAEAGPGRTQVTYQTTITFNGVAKLADPAAKLLFTKVAGEVVENITNVARTL